MLKHNAHDPFPIQRRGNRSFQQIVCDRCGLTDARTTHHGSVSPPVLERHWRTKGWDADVRKQSFICPLCVKKDAEARRNKREICKVDIAQPPSQSSALAKKIMSDLLFEHYDLSAQNYKDGWDDKRIATEAGLSETFVAQRRSADYGPIKPKKPPAAKQARAALVHLDVLLKSVISRSQALESEAKKALSVVTEAIAAIDSDADHKSSGGAL